MIAWSIPFFSPICAHTYSWNQRNHIQPFGTGLLRSETGNEEPQNSSFSSLKAIAPQSCQPSSANSIDTSKKFSNIPTWMKMSNWKPLLYKWFHAGQHLMSKANQWFTNLPEHADKFAVLTQDSVAHEICKQTPLPTDMPHSRLGNGNQCDQKQSQTFQKRTIMLLPPTVRCQVHIMETILCLTLHSGWKRWGLPLNRVIFTVPVVTWASSGQWCRRK